MLEHPVYMDYKNKRVQQQDFEGTKYPSFQIISLITS